MAQFWTKRARAEGEGLAPVGPMLTYDQMMDDLRAGDLDAVSMTVDAGGPIAVTASKSPPYDYYRDLYHSERKRTRRLERLLRRARKGAALTLGTELPDWET